MITQQEADYLISLTKVIENPKKLKFPQPGEQKEISVLSIDCRLPRRLTATVPNSLTA